jgi:hAT family C-terminal dimerisation region
MLVYVVAWWEQFGNETPELQGFAMRVLSQCCSATGCEKNWNTFEFLHSKRHNHIEYQRLTDLVFVRYNLRLCERYYVVWYMFFFYCEWVIWP